MPTGPDQTTTHSSYEDKALLAHQASALAQKEELGTDGNLPMGKIKHVNISRVIVGGNLFNGVAHARNLKYVSQLMYRYFTDEKRFEVLNLCEENGINTNVDSVDLVSRYNKETGGSMQVIAQLDPARGDWSDDRNPDGAITTTKDAIKKVIDAAAEKGCVGAYLLGCRGDRWVKANRVDLIAEFVSLAKERGMIGGVGGHDVRVPMACEENGVDADFYFKTIHPETYWSSIPKQEREPFQVDSFGEKDNDCMWELYPNDTIEFMNSVTKPWIGFKVLAAGAIPPKEGFRFAFENGADFIAPGMFDWQVSGNVKLAKEILAEVTAKGRARPWV